MFLNRKKLAVKEEGFMEILSLGEKIKRKRKELGLTLKDLAGDRITPGQISLVESGKSNPSMDLLEYLAESLNSTVEYLMESEESQAEKICLYYENIAESQILNDEVIQAENHIETVLYYAEKYNLNFRKARNLYLRGKMHLEKNELAIAQQYFLSANVIFIRSNNHEDIAQTFKYLGIITLKLKAYHSANSYFQQSEDVYLHNDIGNDFLLGEIYYYRAITFYKLENTSKSIDYSFLAQDKFGQIDSKKEYAKSLLLISEQYSKKGDLDNAIKYSKKTLEVFRELNDQYYISKIENNLGKLFFEFENIEQSFIHYNKAREIRIKNCDDNITETLVNICENFIKLKEIETAKEILREIMDEVDKGNNRALISYYLLKYKIDILEGAINEAENTLIMAHNYTDNMGYLEEQAELSIKLGKHYIDWGFEDKAAKYLNDGVIIFKKLGILNKDF